MKRSEEIKSKRGNYPKKPIIRKLGTISCNMIVETTPIVYKEELLRFEVVRKKSFTSSVASAHWRELEDSPCLRFINVRTNESTPLFAENHTFGFPIVVGDYRYVVTGKSKVWGADTLTFMRSLDLVNWEEYKELELPGYKIYNMNIAFKDGVYTLMIEISSPEDECGKPYTFRFLQSKDMTNWTMLPKECVFQKDRYAGSPSIYAFEDDPYYYVGYLEEYPENCYANCIARSKDFINWEYSLLNPVLMYDEYEDKKIASPFLTVEDRKRIDEALDINNSDMELCEFLGRTIIYYSWGDQLGCEFLAEACYEGPMKEFLQGFFEKKQ